MVDIDHHQGDRFLTAAAVGPGLRQGLLKAAAIAHTREGILRGQLSQQQQQTHEQGHTQMQRPQVPAHQRLDG